MQIFYERCLLKLTQRTWILTKIWTFHHFNRFLLIIFIKPAIFEKIIYINTDSSKFYFLSAAFLLSALICTLCPAQLFIHLIAHSSNYLFTYR